MTGLIAGGGLWLAGEAGLLREIAIGPSPAARPGAA
jgi:hypothetical protein